MRVSTLERSAAADAQEELVSAARDLIPLLSANAARAATDRRLPDENVTAMREAGLLRLGKPIRFGGSAVNTRTQIEVFAELARGCGSSAWVATLFAGGAFGVGLMAEAGQRDVWGENQDANVCGIIEPAGTVEKVEGGYLIREGRWPFASGSWHAQWVNAAIPIPDEDGQTREDGLALIPLSDLSIDETWFVAGMQGTGSNTLVGADVFVPEHRVTPLARLVSYEYAAEHENEAFFRSTFSPYLILALVGPMLGLVQGALDLVSSQLGKGRRVSHSIYERSIDSPSTQINFANAVELLDTAKLHAYRSADMIDVAAERGEELDFLKRARIRMDTGYVAERCREAMDRLLNLGGAGSFASANPVQRKWRDLETCTRHGAVNPDLGREIYGRALLGIEGQVSRLV